MSTQTDTNSIFQKVGPCLYRYTPTGVYYARIKVDGKEIRQSLRTIDRKLADRALRRLKDEQSGIDRSQGKLTLGELCESYEKTVQHQSGKTVVQKTYVADRIKNDWPTGNLIQVAKIKPSECDMWLARYRFGVATRNFHIQVLKDVFKIAVRDRVILVSPAQHLKYTKRDKPIRKTPTFEQFQQIVESIRAQKFNGHNADESADFVEFIGLAGLGQAEVAALTFDDIDWQREQIITFRHKTKAGFAIPLYPQLRPLLERRHAQRGPGVDRVFKIDNAKKAIAAACKRLKLPAFGHRSFRRMFVTRAIEKGVDVKVIAEWQGHRDGGKLILDTYSHVRQPHSKRMAALMTTEQPDNIIPMEEGGAA
jgi:integrase